MLRHFPPISERGRITFGGSSWTLNDIWRLNGEFVGLWTPFSQIKMYFDAYKI